MQRMEETPPLKTQAPSLALADEGVGAGLMEGETGAVVLAGLSPRALDRSPPPLVVEAAQSPPPALALALKESGEGPLELLAGAGVDDGVDAAVEVAQPEDHFEHHPSGLQGREK